MKRILVEVSCGLAALVVMVSFHRKITQLQDQTVEVQRMRAEVDAAVAKVADRVQAGQQGEDRLTALQSRLRDLEEQLSRAKAGSTLAASLQDDLTRAKSDLALFRSQVSTDVERTKQLVDAYITEVRSNERDAAMRMSEARGAIATIAGQLHRDPRELTRTMLLPTVQLNGDDTVGSGTLIWSGENPKTNQVESYVMTSYHVVRNILADTPKAAKEGFSVTIYLPDDKVDVKGKMVASNPKIDAALVQLQTTRVFPNVASVLPREQAEAIKVWDPVCAVGCPLGNDPVPTQGEVSSLKNELNGANYLMINAPTYFGNSGGGVYRADTHQLIGVFSKIYTHGKGNPVVIPHMGLCTPISGIYAWLTEEGLDHLLQSQGAAAPIDLSNLATPIK